MAIPAILDDGDIQINDIAFFELLIPRNTVNKPVIDRCTDRFGVGAVAGGLVIQWGRNGALYIDHVLVAESIQFTGRDAGFDKRRNINQGLQTQAGRPSGASALICSGVLRVMLIILCFYEGCSEASL